MNDRSTSQRELGWHDQHSAHRSPLDRLLYDPPAFDPVVRSGLAFLRAEQHEPVLDLGCGDGKETLKMGQLGLCVIGVDLSYQQLSHARQRVERCSQPMRVHFVQANAEELPFEPDSFHAIYGKAILHHLDIDVAAAEIKRLLAPDGRAVFAEPMAYHPLFWLGRRLTPGLRAPDEHPLTPSDLRRFVESFGSWEIEKFFLTTPLAYPVRLLPGGEALFRRLHAWLQLIDHWLIEHFALLGALPWYAAAKVVEDRHHHKEGEILHCVQNDIK